MSNLAVEMRELTKQFGEHHAVNGMNIAVKSGTVYGFLGPNGCGKTTTLRMLSGLLTPSSGEIRLFGERVEGYSIALRQRIGYMSQRFSLYNELSSYENLRFYAGLYGLEGNAQQQRIEEIFELTKLHRYRNALVGTLSGGWRQRVALGAAIMHRPKLLFLDEPTSGVDPVSSRLFWEIVYKLAGSGVTIIASTHSMNEAEHCDEVGFLDAGRLIQSGTPHALKASFPGKLISIVSDDTIALLRTLQQQFGAALSCYIYGNEVRIHLFDGNEKAFGSYDYKVAEPTLEDLFVYMSEHNDVAAS